MMNTTLSQAFKFSFFGSFIVKLLQGIIMLFSSSAEENQRPFPFNANRPVSKFVRDYPAGCGATKRESAAASLRSEQALRVMRSNHSVRRDYPPGCGPQVSFKSVSSGGGYEEEEEEESEVPASLGSSVSNSSFGNRREWPDHPSLPVSKSVSSSRRWNHASDYLPALSVSSPCSGYRNQVSSVEGTVPTTSTSTKFSASRMKSFISKVVVWLLFAELVIKLCFWIASHISVSEGIGCLPT